MHRTALLPSQAPTRLDPLRRGDPRSDRRRSWRRLVGGGLVLALTALNAQAMTPAAAAASPAATPITADTTTVNGLWWVADAVDRNSGTELIRLLYFESVLASEYRTNPSLDATTTAAEIGRLEAAVAPASRSNLLGDEAVPAFLAQVHQALSTGSWSAGLRTAAAVSTQYYTNHVKEIDPSGMDQVLGSTDLATDSTVGETLAPSVLGAVVALAHDAGQPSFRKAQDALFASMVAPIGDTADQLIAANPHLSASPAMQRLNVLIDSGGAISTDLPALQDMLAADLSSAGSWTDSAISEIHVIDGIEANGADAVVGKSPSDAQKQAQQDAQKLLDDYDSGGEKAWVSLLSGLVGFSNASAGKAALAIGTAAITIADSIGKFMDLAAKLANPDVAAALGSAAMGLAGAALTGNIIGAVITLATALGNNPDPVVAQVQQLQDQVTRLGTELNERFDVVDRNLSAIYSQLTVQFARIDVQLNVIEGGVADLLSQLVDIDRKLDATEGSLWSSIHDTVLDQLRLEINAVLGYGSASGTPLPYADYLRAASDFRTDATVNDRGPSSVVPPGQPVDDADLAGVLAAFPLSSEFDYLSEVASTWGVALPGQLPNSADWLLSARAYVALAEDYPSDAVADHDLTADVAAMAGTGAQLQAFEKAVTTGTAVPYSVPGRAGVSGGQANLNSLFQLAMSRYDRNVATLVSGLQQEEATFTGKDQINPFGGIDYNPTSQPLPKVTPSEENAYTTIGCGLSIDNGPGKDPTHLTISTATVDRLIPGAMKIDQWYLGTGNASLCLSAHWDITQNDPVGKVQTTTGRLTFTVTSNWAGSPNSGPVYSQSIVDGAKYTLCTQFINEPPKVCDIGTLEQEILHADLVGWSSFSTRLAADTGVATVDAGLAGQLTAAASGYLTSEQSALYAQIVRDSGSPLLHAGASGMAGIVAAMDAYAWIGMPTTMSEDEVLDAMLNGSEGLPTDGTVATFYADAAKNPPATDAMNGLLALITQRENTFVHQLGADLAVLRGGFTDGSAATTATLAELAVVQSDITSAAPSFAPAAVTHTVQSAPIGGSSSTILTVNNQGVGPMTVSAVSATGTGYSVGSTTCSTVAGHGSCTVAVRFAPTTAGVHAGRLTVTTNAGSASTALSGSTVDVPVVTVTAKPAAYLRSASASISYRIADPVAQTVTASCTLDAKATPCGSPKSFTHLAQGRHVFVVTARNAHGATGSATVSWVVDTVSPTVTTVTAPAVSLGASVAFHWGGTDASSGIAGYVLQYTSAKYAGVFPAWRTIEASTTATSYTVTGLTPGAEYCVRVQARDRAGNLSAVSRSLCTTAPLDDRSLSGSALWTRATVPSAYRQTETQTSHSGATVSTTSIRVSHLALLATVTPTAGSAAVYVGSTLVGTVSLRSAVGRYRSVLWLPAVSSRAGVVTVKALAGGPVRIDGLVSLRTP